MARCEVCGNDYAKPLRIEVDGKRRIFDSFECAIHALAPRCSHCGCRIIGHGMEADDRYYCCKSCAEKAGEQGLADHAAA